MKSILHLLLLTALFPAQATAASTGWVEQEGARIRLVAAEPAPDAAEIRAALQIELKPGWKTYWRDPGDAGVPPQVKIDTGGNIAGFTMDYPAPERFGEGKGASAGYKHAVAFPLTLKLAQPGAAASVKASTFLGICDEICVPVQTDFQLDVPLASASTADQALVASMFDALPKAGTQEFGVISLKGSGKSLEAQVTAPMPDAAPELFLAADGFMFGVPKPIASLKGVTRYSVAVVFSPKNAKIEETGIFYTAKTGGMAVSGLARVKN